MTTSSDPRPPSPSQPLEFRKKDGTLSKMRSHGGNIPVLPQTKLCPHCPAKFTRTTHLNRHLRNHTNERSHTCDVCGAQFTRSDLLSRHRKGCINQAAGLRRKSCLACTESKIKCNRELPCSKCTARGKECVYSAKPKATRSRRPAPTPSLAIAPSNSQSEVARTSASTVPNEPSDTLSTGTSLTGATDPPLSVASSDWTSAASTSVTESSAQVPVDSHLASLYNHDMFEPFFSDVFSSTNGAPSIPLSSTVPEPPPPPPEPEYVSDSLNDFLWGTGASAQNYNSFYIGYTPEHLAPSSSTLQSAVSNVRQTPFAELPSGLMTQEEIVRKHYLTLFYDGFVEQVPVVHAPSFRPEGPPVLLSIMQACGAIYVKTRAASDFILDTLVTCRHLLGLEMKSPSTCDHLNLILCVVLLHTLGMFCDSAEERAESSSFHGMLIMMIRHVNFVSQTNSWSADMYNHLPLDEQWRQWALHEMAKRALLLSYLQDCSQCIYFTLPSSYQNDDINFELPCDNKLWNAQTAEEWWSELHRESPYGTPQERLTCPSLPRMLQLVSEPRALTDLTPISYFAHWALIHGVIRRLFTVCTEGLGNSYEDNGTAMEQELYRIQFALHNWLHLWIKRPEVLNPNVNENAEPPFMQNPLPFYWLGQVALMAYQEQLPPFDSESYSRTSKSRMDIRFWQVKKWLRQIRGFLTKHGHGHAPTILWDELMNIRLQSWSVDLDRPANDDPHGLLGFFVQ